MKDTSSNTATAIAVGLLRTLELYLYELFPLFPYYTIPTSLLASIYSSSSVNVTRSYGNSAVALRHTKATRREHSSRQLSAEHSESMCTLKAVSIVAYNTQLQQQCSSIGAIESL